MGCFFESVENVGSLVSKRFLSSFSEHFWYNIRAIASCVYFMLTSFEVTVQVFG